MSKGIDVDPWSLKVMRTDLAADTEAAPVPWFKDHSYIGGVGRLSPGSDWLTDFPDFGRTALRSPIFSSEPDLSCMRRTAELLVPQRQDLSRKFRLLLRIRLRQDPHLAPVPPGSAQPLRSHHRRPRECPGWRSRLCQHRHPGHPSR